MFTVAQRDAARDRVLEMARDDDRVVAAAIVGSLALGAGDRYSDLDLTFAVADGVPLIGVLDEWAGTLAGELEAVHLVDLVDEPTVYRVLLLPGALQFDLSMSPAALFFPKSPRFRLVFGETAPAVAADDTGRGPGLLGIPTPAVARDIFGWAVVYAVHARACIERRRVWQAEHYVGAVRDHALALACLREGVPASEARGYDSLSSETLARFAQTHVGAAEPDSLRSALAASVRALLHEGGAVGLPHADTVARGLAELG